jgi:diguanylate cyclase (GGDEF)-like protein/PAS domain S-box-containing protein
MSQTSSSVLENLNKPSGDIILVTDGSGRIVEVNDVAVAAFGQSRAALLQRQLTDLLVPAAQPAFAAAWQQASQQRQWLFATDFRRSDNTTFPAETNGHTLTLGGQQFHHHCIRALGQASATADPRDPPPASTLELFPDPVWQADRDGRLHYCNRAWLDFTGFSLAQALATGWLDSLHPEDRTACLQSYQDAASSGQPFVREYRLRHHSGDYRQVIEHGKPQYDADNVCQGYLGVCHDLHNTQQIWTTLPRSGQYDPLTGLPDRVLLEDRLRQALANARRNRSQVVLLLSDLDCFKLVNDSLGHAIGDRLLQAVTGRLRDCLRESDTLSRRGGDEFVVVLSELRNLEDAAHVAEKLLKSLAEPYTLDGHQLYITASIGISIFPDDGQDLEGLLKNADVAMYYAKQNGRNRYQFFTPAMNTRAFDYLMMQNRLRRALERQEFELYYQPQVDLRRNTIVGAEALIRWRDPEQGIISPGTFIPVAEESGLIVPIGEWVIQEACQQHRRWQVDGLPTVPIAVNLSAAQFRRDNFQQVMETALVDNKLNPNCLELELTEGILMQDTEDAILTLRELKSTGVQLSIDDFGTGYSSLSYLKRFPIDKLKVDQSFVRDITLNEDDAEITKAIINMAHGLGLKVIAEGVETEDQLKFLRWQRCDDMQGYYYSRPLPAGDFQALLSKSRGLVQ